MANGARFEVDLEQEKVLVEGEWLGRQELTARIQRMLASLDFRISGAGAALEALGRALAEARAFQVRFLPEDAQRLEAVARHLNVDPRTLARHAVLGYLATQPVIQAAGQAVLSSEPATPDDAARAVALTAKKAQEATRPEPGPVPKIDEDAWFKK